MRLIVLVHCSNGDVMASARLRVGTLFGEEINMIRAFSAYKYSRQVFNID